MVNYTGLTHFIRDVNQCMDKASEYKRVEDELANIRKSFIGKPGSYDKRKYVWKLAYIQLLGHEILSGHMQAIQLLSSPRYVEKAVGYIAVSILIPVDSQFATLVVNSMRTDMLSSDEQVKVLALTAIANLGGTELAENVYEDIVKLSQDNGTSDVVRSRAINCLISLYRTAKDNVALDYLPTLIPFVTHGELGVVVSATNLFEAVPSLEDDKASKRLIRGVAEELTKLTSNKSVDIKYHYRETPHPWLQIKLLKVLQKYPPSDDKKTLEFVGDAVQYIFDNTVVGKDRNKNNADHAILFEAINVVIHYGKVISSKQRKKSLQLLSGFIGDESDYGTALDNAAITYLTLDCMSRMTSLEGAAQLIQKQRKRISLCMENPDVSIRKKAIHVLFSMCDEDCAIDVVQELLDFLHKADYSVKEEMILKIAILAEKFAPSFTWYVDVILQMITGAGDFVTDDIWFRAVQIISQHEDVQEYASRKLYESLKQADVHETIIKCAGYVVAEYAFTLVEAVTNPITPELLFESVRKHLKRVTNPTKALLIHSCFKLMNTYAESLTDPMKGVLDIYKSDMDPEIQQRVIEYMELMKNEDVMLAVMDVIPPFQPKESSLLKRLKKMMARGGNKDDDEEEEDEDDDEDDDDDDKKASAPKEKDKKSGQGDLDLFGGIIGSSNPKDKFLKNCLISQKAVLFEDSQIQIGIQHEYKNDQGRMTIYYTNRGSSLSSMNITIGTANGAVLNQQKDPPTSLSKGKDASQAIMLKAAKPFSAPPTLSIVAGSYKLELSLPVHIISFCVPAELNEDQFGKHWESLNGKELSKNIPGAANVASVGQLMPRMRFGSIIPGKVVSGATTFKVGGQSIGVLVKIDTKSTSVAVRANNVETCKGMLHCFEIVLNN